MSRTYHLPRKPTGELAPMRALRREPRPTRVGVVVRPGIVALGARPLRGQTGLAVSPRPGEPYLDSIRLQRADARELDGAVDDMGRTRRERRAWASVLRGFALALALLAGPAAAVTLIEPTTMQDTGGLLAGPAALWACAYWIDHAPTAVWLRPTGTPGAAHPLPTPTAISDLPRRYEARCLNAAGWGPAASGTLELRLTGP